MANIATNTANTRVTDWRSVVLQSDPEWNQKQHSVVEYEFTSPGRRGGNDLVHRDGMRVFRGDPNKRGAYTP